MDCARLNQAVYFYKGGLPGVVGSKTYTDLSFHDEIESANLTLYGKVENVKGGVLEVVRNDSGSKTLYITFKGTSSPAEVIHDLESAKASEHQMFGAAVASGFFDVYNHLFERITGAKG